MDDRITFTVKDDILTLLVHLGYLVYDKADETVFIPNEEIANEFLNAVAGPDWSGLIDAPKSSDRLLSANMGHG